MLYTVIKANRELCTSKTMRKILAFGALKYFGRISEALDVTMYCGDRRHKLLAQSE